MHFKFSALTLAVVVGLSGCEGESGSESTNETATDSNYQVVLSPQAKPEINPENPAEKLLLLKQLRFADASSEMNAATFGLETWNPVAIELKNDVLYIANSTQTAHILRYDLKTKKVLSPIRPESLSGLAKAWDTVSDIYIDNNRLYVGSFPASRIDVIDLEPAEPVFMMSLGTGQWWGDAKKLIVHTHAIAANDDFVFSPDIQGRINIWKQSVVTKANHLNATKHAYFALPGCERACKVKLNIQDDYLYATLDNGNTFVYDAKNIAANTTIQPLKRESGLATSLDFTEEGLIHAAKPNGSIVSFKSQDLSKLQRVLPTETLSSIHQYRLEGQEQKRSLAKAFDLISYNGQILSLNNQKITILPLHYLNQRQSTLSTNPIELKKDLAISSARMLQDGESWATLTNVAERHIYMDRILSAELFSDAIQLQSYSAVAVNDLEIQAKLKHSDAWFVLAKLDQLDAFSKIKLKLALNDRSRFNRVDGNGSIQLQGLSQFSQLPAELFDFKITSKTDLHAQKLASIKPKWKIYFGTYNQEGDSKWRRINPLYAREWTIMMTNFAYMLSTPEFEHMWFNHKKVMGHDFFGNDGPTDSPNGFYNAAKYSAVYNNIMNRPQISLGITAMGGGLGGGVVLGVDHWIYFGHYRQSGYGIVAHEFGHHWGNHSSAWARADYGFQPMMDWLNFYFQRQAGGLPYMDPNVNKFHLAAPSQLYGDISPNILNGVASKTPLNPVDRYFAANPLSK